MYRHKKIGLDSYQEKFEILLTTWPFHAQRWLDMRGPMPDLDMEKQYGDGHYDDRKKILRTSIELLYKHGQADLDKLYVALYQERHSRAEAELARAKRLGDREARIEPERRLRVAAIQALREYRTHRLSWDPLAQRVPDGIIHIVDQAISRLDPTNFEPERFKQGRPKQSVSNECLKAIKEARVPTGIKGRRQAFAAAGCKASPKNLQKALLMAVGLLQYSRR